LPDEEVFLSKRSTKNSRVEEKVRKIVGYFVDNLLGSEALLVLYHKKGALRSI